MNSKKIKKTAVFGNYELINQIAPGGNSVVWKAKSINSDELRAIKIFNNPELANRYSRFKDEIRVVTNDLKSLVGVVPILDSFLPEDLSKEPGWYSMPICCDFKDQLKNLSFIEVCKVFVDLAETLAEIHSLDIAHRDIKPDNILWYKNRACFSDFGLVNFPEKSGVTKVDERMGPRLILAPEMERNGSNADSIPADIYCLAKTFWIILTGIKEGFEGQYVNENTVGLIFTSSFEKIYWTPIDRLISDSTSNDPKKRPTAQEFARKLTAYLELVNDFHQLNTTQWNEIQTELFGLSRPTSAVWQGVVDITSVLNLLAKYPSLNHCFLPNGGGNTLLEAKCGYEEGSIELMLWPGTADNAFPLRLIYECFPDWQEWNYFRLETKDVAPLNEGSDPDRLYENFVEILEGNYIDRNYWDKNVWEGKPYDDKSVKYITRYLLGTFIFASETGVYNQLDNYMGDMNKLSSIKMRKVIQEVIDKKLKKPQSNPIAKITLNNPSPIIFEPYHFKYLSIKLIRELVKTCDALEIYDKKNRSSDPYDYSKAIFKTDDERDKLKTEVRNILKSYSQNQLSEIMMLINIGRNISGYDRRRLHDYIDDDISESKHNLDYYLGLVLSRNDYIRKGLVKLDVII